MTVRKILISLVLVTLLAISMVACSGTKNICPAYTGVETTSSTNPNS